MRTPVLSGHDTVHPLGRDAEIAAVAAVAGGVSGAPSALIVVGQAGIGKTTLLRHVVERLEPGTQLLSTSGVASSALRVRMSKLFWPLREHSANLPRPLEGALRDLFDSKETAPVSPGLLADAVSALLDVADRPVVLSVDDVDQLDEEARALLLAVAAQLTGTRVRAVFTARRRDVLGGVAGPISTLDLGPVSAATSAGILDAQPLQPDRSVRGEIIRWSRGNPLALVECARAYGHSKSKRFHGATMKELAAFHPVFVHQISTLPRDTRELLVVAAAATGYETIDAITKAAGHGNDLTAWQAARNAGVVEFTDDGHAIFANAMVRAAAYADGDLGAQRSAHRALAADPGLKASLRAWHHAAAAPTPDEEVAAALEDSATESHCLGMELELARALQRSAEMSPRRDDAARRFAQAAGAAHYGGDPDWALQLTEVPLSESTDPDVVAFAALIRASANLQCGRLDEAAHVIRAVLDGARPADTHLQLALLHAAAGVAFYTGDCDHRRDLHRWLPTIETPTTTSRYQLPFPIAVAPLQRSYIGMYAGTAVSDCVHPQAPDPPWPIAHSDAATNVARQVISGVMAYSTEHSAAAATQLGNAVGDLSKLTELRGFTFALAPLSWALLDTGRWAELTHLLDIGRSNSTVHSMTLVEREIAACEAQLHAIRGDVEAAGAALRRARTIGPGAPPPSAATKAAFTRASGWAAIAVGDYELAYHRFRDTFHAAARPAHFVVSYRAIADMAWAAARCGRTEEAAPLIAEIGRKVMVKPPTRLRLLQHQASALVTDGMRAEHHYKLAVFDPAGEEWPLERARARLHYGEWLRRARRPAEARPLLGAALEVFDDLGAKPLADIARSELRAAGVGTAEPVPHEALHTLTAQERQVVTMAASGMTNREIADRLKISPRTVSSHLYHVYPKLGVTRRHELREFAVHTTAGR